MNRKLKVEFWHLVSDNGDIVTPTLQRLLADTGPRHQASGSDYLRLTELSGEPSCFEGDLVKIRMNEAPVIAPLERPVKELDLKKDEGVGEETAFFFDQKSSVLAIQRNRYGPSAHSWLDFIHSAAGNPPPTTHLAVVLRKDAWTKLDAMQEIKTFKIRLAGLRNAKMLSRQSHGLAEIGRLVEEFQAPHAEVVFSIGHGKGGLESSRIAKCAHLLASLWPASRKEVTSLAVSGLNKDGEKDVFDLVTFRMVQEVTVSERGRHLSYGARKDAVRRCWAACQQEIADTIVSQ